MSNAKLSWGVGQLLVLRGRNGPLNLTLDQFLQQIRCL
jgi:hypothetical protein